MLSTLRRLHAQLTPVRTPLYLTHSVIALFSETAGGSAEKISATLKEREITVLSNFTKALVFQTYLI